MLQAFILYGLDAGSALNKLTKKPFFRRKCWSSKKSDVWNWTFKLIGI